MSRQPEAGTPVRTVGGDTFEGAREVAALASRYRLVLPETRRRRSGDSHGRNAGGSIEFHDRREFTVGDDLRHVDWRGMARTDKMLVKLYREETVPTTELIVDGSASMSVTAAKSLKKLQLAWFLECAAESAQAHMKIWSMARHPVPVETAFDLVNRADQPVENWFPALAGGPALSRCGVRIFLSDFLFPFIPAEFEHAVGRADRTVVIQLLSSFEANPAVGGLGTMLWLENAEGPGHVEVRLDEGTTREYVRRLGAMQNEMREIARRYQGVFMALDDTGSLEETVDRLFRAGIVEP